MNYAIKIRLNNLLPLPKQYKPQTKLFLMVKTPLKSKALRKACFGTKEWSENSGICNRCESKESCGKIKAKLSQ